MFGSSGKDDSEIKELGHDSGWEREVVEKLAFATIKEQRSSRRWKIFFRLAFLLLLVGFLFASFKPIQDKKLPGGSHTAVVDVNGIIFDGSEAAADVVIKGLQAAVKNSGTKGIILKINSPGGSPVQAAYIYDEIRRLKKSRPDLPIYAVVADICASGGYFIAAAADSIFVNQSSIIGSIGVVMNGFGFVDTMEKMGVERRLMTAGAHKGMLDPFSPQNEAEKEHTQKLLDGIHQNFITAVREGRGERLKENSETFSGLVWLGSESIKLGIADDFGTVQSVARNQIGEENIVDFTHHETAFDLFVKGMGASMGQSLLNAFTSASSFPIR
ncbi:MAG: S49 family peptidase [Gammaproteobacteria bacterium]|nr:MAG: S49 family peptidase [Gammaproteobacteria bacterium]